jgi:hypothetical protein
MEPANVGFTLEGVSFLEQQTEKRRKGVLNVGLDEAELLVALVLEDLPE